MQADGEDAVFGRPLAHVVAANRQNARILGQLDSQLGKRFTLTTGLRIERRLTNYSDNNGVDSDPDKALWGGRLALEYQLDDDRMAYAEISRG